MSIRSPTRRPRGSEAWHRQSIVWLAAGVLAASLAGCVWLIVVAERHADPPLDVGGLRVLKVPLARPPAGASAATR